MRFLVTGKSATSSYRKAEKREALSRKTSFRRNVLTVTLNRRNRVRWNNLLPDKSEKKVRASFANFGSTHCRHNKLLLATSSQGPPLGDEVVKLGDVNRQQASSVPIVT